MLSAAETAHVLRTKLGPLRAWSDFLTDCIRHKTNLHGLTLMPAAVMKIGRSKRPVYALADIAGFVREVWDVLPESRTPRPLAPIYVEVDPKDCRSWRLKVLAPSLTMRLGATT